MRILSPFIAALAFMAAFNANAATYLLLSQTNTFAAGITNAAKAYTDAHASPPMSGTVSNNVASAGLLSVDATKTNGIAATAAHITNAWGIFTGDTNKTVSGAGTLVSLPTDTTANWTASGPTNSTLAGNASTFGVVATNGITAGASTNDSGLHLNALTTTQRDALTGAATNAGSLLWNSTQTRVNVHNGSVWTDGFVRLAGDTMTGALAVGNGTITADAPVLNLSQTWNNSGVTFTGLKLNVTNTASGASSLLMDLQVGGTSAFKVDKSGLLTLGASLTFSDGGKMRSTGGIPIIAPGGTDGYEFASAGLTLTSTKYLAWSFGAAFTPDTYLYRDAAATLQLGADAATATAQTIKAHDGSGTDKAGANLTLEGGQSTGTGRGGDLVHRSSLTATTGSSANSYSTRRYESAKFVDLSGGVATLIATITCGTNQYLGANIVATVFAADSTDRQSLTSRIQIDCVNTNGVVIPTLSQVDNTAAVTVGTLACTYTASNWTNAVAIFANSVSSLTETTNRVNWIISELNSSDVATVTPQ